MTSFGSGVTREHTLPSVQVVKNIERTKAVQDAQREKELVSHVYLALQYLEPSPTGCFSCVACDCLYACVRLRMRACEDMIVWRCVNNMDVRVCEDNSDVSMFGSVPGYHQRAAAGGSSQADCGEAKG